MTDPAVSVGEKSFKVKRTGASRLRTVHFEIEGREYHAIEQNPEKPSRWGQLARQGRKVVQLRDVSLGKYVAVVVDGKAKEYSK